MRVTIFSSERTFMRAYGSVWKRMEAHERVCERIVRVLLEGGQVYEAVVSGGREEVYTLQYVEVWKL